jgi:hypothetical protein
MATRRFPAPWCADKVPGGYVVRDANGQALVCGYSRENEAAAIQAKVLRAEEARRIVRGLHFHHTGEVLPKNWPTARVRVFAGTMPPPDDVICFANIAEPRGDYPGVLDYKFDTFPEAKNLHYWLLLLWNRIILRVVFHDSACTCETCTSDGGPVTRHD